MVQHKNRKYPIDINWRMIFKDLNVPIQVVLRHAQMPLALLNQRTPMVTAEEYFRLWDGLAQVLKDVPAFPLRLVEAMSPEVFRPTTFACLCSHNLNMALERIKTYKPLVGPCHMVVEIDDRQTQVTFVNLLAHQPLQSSLVAFELAFWVHLAHIATREPIVPLQAQTSRELADTRLYAEYFGCEVTLGNSDCVIFSSNDANRPFMTTNDGMWSIFEPQLQQRLTNLTHESSFRERVRACLTEMLASGRYSMSEVAKRLAISTRTLQRRLQQENTHFQQVLDELRHELAHHYLSTSDYTNGQIAFLLGYEETSSFFRAFRSWTDQTPEVVREQYRLV